MLKKHPSLVKGAKNLVETILQTNKLTIQADITNKQVLMHIHPNSANLDGQLQLAESDCVELIYTFLSINREFHNEKRYFTDDRSDTATI